MAPLLPAKAGQRLQWGRCLGASLELAIARTARQWQGMVVVITPDVQEASRLEQQLSFFLKEGKLPILHFPDWETLPYDLFSPLPELVSQRLFTLHQLQKTQQGILIVPAATAQQRILPPEYLDAHSLALDTGDTLQLEPFRLRLERAGYHCVSQVMAHGEFAVRGSLLDLFPMGAPRPYRIDLFDDEIDSIRLFNPETQRSEEKVDGIRLLPAREFPVDEAAIKRFRRQYRNQFEGDPQSSLIYREVSEGNFPGGLEYYLPLFYEETATLFDYLGEDTLIIHGDELPQDADHFYTQVEERYEQRRHDIERPLLPPSQLYLDSDSLVHHIKAHAGISWRRGSVDERRKGFTGWCNFDTRALPPLAIQARASRPAGLLEDYLGSSERPVLFTAESSGRREHLQDTLAGFGLRPRQVGSFQEFLELAPALAITVAPLEEGLELGQPPLAIVPETLLLGERVRQVRKRRKAGPDADQVVRNLAELQLGSPVVHEDHGVGRYLGLQHLDVGGMSMEFLTLEYARGDKLYVPVSSLHLISRYTGATEENAPLHRLGSDQWEKARRKAAQKVRDAAAELLEIYARREARQGYPFPAAEEEYRQFASEFEFEETPDQERAIEEVISDMISPRPMDRVVCGDVGFGKTEVAMRAAFLATQGGKQVAVLVPTTLLAQQHYENFADRFADWPVKIAALSRFNSTREVNATLKGLENGTVDIVVGTHKILSQGIAFKDLGLVIIDEEHRFGVRHKERLKALRAEVDILTLTATPIPRTLNMAMSGMRDLSVIATPPAKRQPIKTFVQQWNDVTISEACQRELQRGGQVYVLHNDVSSIERMVADMEKLVPGARVDFAHGQMRERELERIMRDFYHQRFNILVATTIIESGIDVPTANTIIINRADKLGLAQLHQLRGRVGRSHHRAYAYLITPPPKAMTRDAVKRLQALESLEDLGAGFTLATHDLEIRGAGELLGEDQSGQIHEVGFTLYTQMLERAVRAIREGRQPELDRPLDHGTEIDLNLPALLPEDYLPDVHIRLIQYKRIASAASREELRELRVEMIDRFGLLPEQAKNLFDITELKLDVQPLGIRKIEAGPLGGKIHFDGQPAIDPARIIHLIQTRPRQFKLDGSDKLKFFAELEEPETRVEKLRGILGMLR
ncbi:transcription-repair coupling factor [Thiolapillus brandeum]|uniref:Transcription-repair-coupling factor n=2 Tax=Thiolapillus brandeum TaxID=1076588 RepID=A0A7U6GJ03_9GAMM|nr:transcription-repair coupling factor [Thiolapillus brandeum]